MRVTRPSMTGGGYETSPPTRYLLRGRNVGREGGDNRVAKIKRPRVKVDGLINASRPKLRTFGRSR